MPLLCAAAPAAADPAYLAELVGKSRQLRLAERPEWHKLVHYVPNLVLPGVHSLVDSPRFFNSPEGMTDPHAELEATLASFFSTIEETPERQNPQCLFVARRAWLDEQLGFDAGRLPPQPCARYRQWHEALNPAGLTLIFASAYLNNPSSMYGHTLLRVDAKDQDERTRLLAYTINFSANTDETNGLAFAVNGLLGGYPGTFSIMPYYLKVREYSDLENRDLWEYPLSFTAQEVDRVLRHAWELGPAYFRYFFFDENCSYQLLGLLQVARPEMDLTGAFRGWAMPSDTVREITMRPGLVRAAVYRPSHATVLKHRLSLLGDSDRMLVRELGLGQVPADDAALAALGAARAAGVLETSHDYSAYRRAIGSRDIADPAEHARRLLLARGRIDAPAQAGAIPVPEVPPDRGHASARAALAAGREAGAGFQELRLRATYHDLLDSDEGFVRGAQIQFFDIAARHYAAGPTRLERFVPIDIVSLSPRDAFFRSWSWKIAAGWQRTRAADGGAPLAFALDGGAGASWDAAGGRALAYAFLDGSARAHERLDAGYALGAGASAGALWDAHPRWRLHGFLRGLRYFEGQRDTLRSWGVEQRVALGRDFALRLDAARRRELERRFNTAAIALLRYF